MHELNKTMNWLQDNNELVSDIRGQISLKLFGGRDLGDDMEIALDHLAEDLALDYFYKEDNMCNCKEEIIKKVREEINENHKELYELELSPHWLEDVIEYFIIKDKNGLNMELTKENLDLLYTEDLDLDLHISFRNHYGETWGIEDTLAARVLWLNGITEDEIGLEYFKEILVPGQFAYVRSDDIGKLEKYIDFRKIALDVRTEYTVMDFPQGVYLHLD